MKVRPLHDKILVKQLEEEDKSKGGIIIPETAKEKPFQGKVVAVGKGKTLEGGDLRPLDVKVGDKVLFERYAGTIIKIEGEEYMMMSESDVLAILEK